MSDRKYFKSEEQSIDFPYYNGKPQSLTVGQWSVLVLVLVVQFFIMSTVKLSFLPVHVATIVMDLFLVLVPLGLLKLFTGQVFGPLFKPLKVRDTGIIIKYVLLAFVVSIASTIVLNIVGWHTSDNGASAQVTSMTSYLFLFIDNIFSLFWEELISLIPFLAVLALLQHRMSRKTAIITSTLVTSIFFGALHLPSYSWNVPMVFTSIVAIRLVLNASYIKTKNIWVTYLIHLVYDSFVFALPAIITLLFKH